MNALPRRYILLDRDGVLNLRNPNGYAKCWEDFEFMPRALDALRLLSANHYAAIVISRQSSVGIGLQSLRDLETITRKLLLEVALSEGHIAQVYYCRHRKEDGCNCFKPNTGLISRASAHYKFRPEETYFVSEGENELAAAAAAGCPCIQILRGAFLQTPAVSDGLHKVASNLYEAAEHILALPTECESEYTALAIHE